LLGHTVKIAWGRKTVPSSRFSVLRKIAVSGKTGEDARRSIGKREKTGNHLHESRDRISEN